MGLVVLLCISETAMLGSVRWVGRGVLRLCTLPYVLRHVSLGLVLSRGIGISLNILPIVPTISWCVVVVPMMVVVSRNVVWYGFEDDAPVPLEFRGGLAQRTWMCLTGMKGCDEFSNGREQSVSVR